MYKWHGVEWQATGTYINTESMQYYMCVCVWCFVLTIMVHPYNHEKMIPSSTQQLAPGIITVHLALANSYHRQPQSQPQAKSLPWPVVAKEFSMALTRALGFSSTDARLIFDALDSEGHRDHVGGEAWFQTERIDERWQEHMWMLLLGFKKMIKEE